MSFGDRALPLVRVLGGQTMVLSPDGSKAAVELDPDAIVVDMGTRDQQDAHGAGATPSSRAYQWRDNDSFFALGLTTAADGDTLPRCRSACCECDRGHGCLLDRLVADAGTTSTSRCRSASPFES